MGIVAFILFLASMTLLVLVSVKPELTRSKSRKQVALILVSLCLIMLLIAVFSVIDDWVRKNETVTAEAPASAVKHTDNTESAGISVSRADAIKRLKVRGFTFERGADLNGEENFVAKVGPTVVRLIGPEANLNSVEIMLGPMDPKNDATFHLVFPSWSNPDIVDWLTEVTTKFQGQHNEDGKKVVYFADITTAIEVFTISSIR